MRRLAILLTGAVVLAVVNYSVYRKEQLLAGGRVVLLELAPVDPRSLMQGDYMALRFELQRSVEATATAGEGKLRDGYLVAELDGRGVAKFRRVDDGVTPLAAGEVRIFYRVRNQQVKLGTNAFFFQEGDEPHYRGARFGEARLGQDGQFILTGLRGEKLEKLGPGR